MSTTGGGRTSGRSSVLWVGLLGGLAALVVVLVLRSGGVPDPFSPTSSAPDGYPR